MIGALLVALSTPPDLTLHLDSVTLGWLRDEPPELLLVCAARWENDGATTQGSSPFGGAFDGLWLVGVDASGGEVFRQSYTFHQSPYAEGTPFEIGTGETAASLSFPIAGDIWGRVDRVRLEGGVAGGGDLSSGFVTDWKPISVFR